jgi:hypothetical protein
MTISGSSLRMEDLRGYPQGEIVLLRRARHHFEARVYNTTGFGRCRAAAFGAIDVERLAGDAGCDLAWKNPRRFWTVDAATIIVGGEPRELQGLTFALVARMHLPLTFDPAQGASAPAYQPAQVHQAGTYEFRAGRPVFLLRSPQGITWVMQAFADHGERHLHESDLSGLAGRLTLPGGWQGKAVTPRKDLVITIKGRASIVSDDLANTYLGCVDGVNNFDPWG